MRLVEAVPSELSHQVKYLFDLFGWITTLHSALDEAFTLLRHLFVFLLAHGPAQQVSFT